MTEIWDMARHVEENPDDYEQRWRLAKKLYIAWEYRLALEHLQVLRNDWEPKLNVARYLAATYYRLGRYEESIRELRAAVETWPKEIGVREQLARVLEVSGKREDAAGVWEEVAELEPHHPLAGRAAKRLRERTRESEPEDELHLSDSDSGIDLTPGEICPNCGAQNSSEFDRCWQCHAPLRPAPAPQRATPMVQQDRPPVLTPETASLIGGLAVIGLLSVGLYLSLRLLFGASAEMPARTLYALYTRELAVTRVVTGVAIIALWPVILRATLSLVRVEEPVPPTLVLLTGLLLGSLTYVLSWLPPQTLILMPILPAVAGLAIILGTFQIGLARAANVFVLHLLMMGVVLVGVFTVSESIRLKTALNPLSEVNAIVHFAKTRESEEPGIFYLPAEHTPMHQPLVWQSTGSKLLDHHGAGVLFTVFGENERKTLAFEFSDSEGTQFFEKFSETPWDYLRRIEPGRAYTVHVTAKETIPVNVRLAGLLPVTLKP